MLEIIVNPSHVHVCVTAAVTELSNKDINLHIWEHNTVVQAIIFFLGAGDPRRTNKIYITFYVFIHLLHIH